MIVSHLEQTLEGKENSVRGSEAAVGGTGIRNLAVAAAAHGFSVFCCF
jgi:hypothetical protein